MKRTRIATAAIVTRETDAGPEVLLARRSPALRFFGGYWAFPGGVVDPVDAPDGELDGAGAHRRCAARELFEEVGLDVGGTVADALGDAGAERALRARLLERTSEAAATAEFAQLLGTGDRIADAVAPVARLTTPPFAPVLYRTTFVHVAADARFEPEIIEGELVDGAFRTPAEWLARWRRGELLIAPPVLFMLEHLDALGLERFLAEIPAEAESLERGRLHPIRNVPGIIMAPLATRTLPPATTTNAYLVGEERFFVVDPAPTDPAELGRLFDLIDERIAGGRDLVGVLLTHHHPDHVGGADATAARHDVPVLASRWTLDALDLAASNQRAIGEGVDLPLGTAPDGSPGWVLRVRETPGHAPGHLAFVESRYGAVIAGDLVSTVSTIVIDPPEGHMATYLASLERMRDMTADDHVVHPAHGPVAARGKAVFERYLVHRQRRLDALRGALEDGLSGEDELTARVYADVDERMLPVAARSLRAALEMLAEDASAEETAPGTWRPLPVSGGA